MIMMMMKMDFESIHVVVSRLKVKATVLKDPTTTDTLANLIPASKAEEALVKKAGSKVSCSCIIQCDGHALLCYPISS